MVFPQSGGKNQGGITNTGKHSIKKNPAKYTQYILCKNRLFFILIYDIRKILKRQIYEENSYNIGLL